MTSADAVKARRAEARRAFVRFVGLSGSGWLLDLGLLMLLSRGLGLPLGVANMLSSATAALAVFLVSRHLVFDAAPGRVAARALVYLGYQVIGIFLASLLIGPAATLAGRLGALVGLQPAAGALAFWGKVFITPPQLVANFLISRFLIQRRLAADRPSSS